MDLSQNQILIFYGWWEMVVCFFAFLSLMAIWFHLGRKQQDKGQVWLALSILCWSFSGAMEILDVNYGLGKSYYISGTRSVLSLLNSLFILLALPWFRYLPKKLEQLIHSKYWIIIVGVPFVFCLLPTLSKLVTHSNRYLISELDVYYSIFTLGILGWVLWESFMKRRLSLLAYLSVICIAITFTAQIYKLSDNHINQVLFSAIFKTCLIMIFFALALSWVKDLVETIQADATKIKLKLFTKKTTNNKFEFIANLDGIFGGQKDISISKTHFDLLKKFAENKLSGSDSWLEIKPKNESRGTKNYDIKDYNEIKRMLHALLDGMIGKGLWSKEHHETPLKEILLERSPDRERKIRLALSQNNISIED